MTQYNLWFNTLPTYTDLLDQLTVLDPGCVPHLTHYFRVLESNGYKIEGGPFLLVYDRDSVPAKWVCFQEYYYDNLWTAFDAQYDYRGKLDSAFVTSALNLLCELYPEHTVSLDMQRHDPSPAVEPWFGLTVQQVQTPIVDLASVDNFDQYLQKVSSKNRYTIRKSLKQGYRSEWVDYIPANLLSIALQWTRKFEEDDAYSTRITQYHAACQLVYCETAPGIQRQLVYAGDKLVAIAWYQLTDECCTFAAFASEAGVTLVGTYALASAIDRFLGHVSYLDPQAVGYPEDDPPDPYALYKKSVVTVGDFLTLPFYDRNVENSE